MRPEDFWLIEPGYQEQYDRYCRIGRETAANSRVAFVAIARNAMPHLANTLPLIEETAGRFREQMLYVFENDSIDGTDKVLDEFAVVRQWVTVEHATLGREDLRGFQPDRTIALAEYRNRCRLWVEKHAPHVDFVVVLDTDPHGGFSPDGVLNSVGWLAEYMGSTQRISQPGGMASYSLYVRNDGGNVGVAQYDAWAARLNWWEDRKEKPGGHQWFHLLMPPVGSEPIQMNSCFGGLAVYQRAAYLSGNYAGGDCEHVAFHKSMRRAGYGMYLNPGCRYAAILP
jgi:hypothetical protein